MQVHRREPGGSRHRLAREHDAQNPEGGQFSSLFLLGSFFFFLLLLLLLLLRLLLYLLRIAKVE